MDAFIKSMNPASSFDQFLLWFLIGLTALVIIGLVAEPLTRRVRYFWRLKTRRERMIPPLGPQPRRA